MKYSDTTYCLFLNASLPEKMTGIESSALKRYQLFQRQLGVTPIYVSFKYDLNEPKVIELFKVLGKVPEHFQLVNLYGYYQAQCDNSIQPNQAVSQERSKVFYCREIKTHTEFYDERGRISYVNYYDKQGRRIKLDNFDRDGFRFRSVMINPETKNRTLEIFYRRDCSVCYTKSFEIIDGKNTLSHIWIYQTNGMVERSFDNEEAFHTYLLEFYLTNAFTADDMVNLIADRGTRLIYNLNRNNIKANHRLFYTVHSFHLNSTLDMNSTVRGNNFYLEKLDEIDGVIVLSPQQKSDIAERFGNEDKLHFIPHTVNYFPKTVPFSQRKPYKVVAAGRLGSEKRFDLMIHIFSRVVAVIPEATLEIFGKGGLKNELQVQIERLNLTNNVFLRDYTNDIYAEFASAKCSLMTSFYEGQPLVMLESLSSGCPVVSSDFRYGPSLMINDGCNGFVVKRGDIQGFADRIIEILTVPTLAETLSNNAYQSIELFKEENVAPLWRELLALESKTDKS